jgi:hypothetical protein
VITNLAVPNRTVFMNMTTRVNETDTGLADAMLESAAAAIDVDGV